MKKKHKWTFFKINGQQSVKLKCVSTKLKNYLKQLTPSFKIYADLEPLLERVKSIERNHNKTSYTGKYQKHIPSNFASKVLRIDEKYKKPLLIYSVKLQSMNVLN